MSESALEEAAVLSAIYCGEGEYQLIQSGAVTSEGDEEAARVEDAGGEEWTTVLLLDHMRSRGRYVKMLERWTEQLHLTTRLLSGRWILVLLRGARRDIKEFCHLLKTVKVDVDSSGKKCKERMMKVLCERPFTFSSSSKHGLSTLELTEAFQEAGMAEMYQQILPLPTL
uniref:RWD domain-containing protein 3 n=1 Tax=Gadus morhua TaxID=8049 RepID=A0A8C5F7D8_GADMO